MGATVLALLSLCFLMVNGDIYLHNPRGCNNRLNGQGRNRRNANRIFDSQNNNRGGYNVGRGMEYYVGSILRVEWTNQHSCGGENNNCEIIMQYMCDDKIRDGATTNTIPEYNAGCDKQDCNSDLEYGMHEDHDYYQTCKYTKRDDRLFTANQNPRYVAKRTRQNPNGQRRGYECPEERDYYPYWRPTPWKDIVIMTNDVDRCAYYREESENVKDRYFCKPPPGYLAHLKRYGDNSDKVKYIPITKKECEEIRTPGNEAAGTGIWTKSPAHGIPAPACVPSQKSRDNHNGNIAGGVTNFYEWTIPNEPHNKCILRLRYNISTNDLNAWNSTSRDNYYQIHKTADISETLAEETGYQFKNDPVIKPFRVLENGQNTGTKFQLKIAVNTAQFGRVFQDRSHAFSILKRPDSIPKDAKIHNLNVRGKRGNIVQTYPATEYDFVPASLNVKCNNEYVHFQWTGSDDNPHNNAGQGRRGTDRSNVCLMGKNKYVKEGNKANDVKHGHLAGSFPADMRNGHNIFGADDNSEQMLCSGGFINGANEELDDAGVYYNHRHYSPKDGGLLKCSCSEKTQNGIKLKVNGVYYYMCTRNNNFTNRSQKAKIICE